MKKRIICLVMLMNAALAFSGCEQAQDIIRQAVQPPDVALSNIMFTGISSSKLDLDAEIEIDNPNPVGLFLAGLDYSFELADNQLFSGTASQGIDISPSGQSFVKLPMSIGYNEVMAAYDSIRGADEVPYRISGTASVDTPIGSIPVPFDIKGEMPVVRPPRINSLDLKVESLSFSSADLALYINLQNPNHFPLDIAAAGYDLALNGKNFSAGSIQPVIVPANQQAALKVPISLNIMSLGMWAYSLLRGASADYNINYSAEYMIKDWPVKQQENKTGTLKIK